MDAEEQESLWDKLGYDYQLFAIKLAHQEKVNRKPENQRSDLRQYQVSDWHEVSLLINPVLF